MKRSISRKVIHTSDLWNSMLTPTRYCCQIQIVVQATAWYWFRYWENCRRTKLGRQELWSGTDGESTGFGNCLRIVRREQSDKVSGLSAQTSVSRQQLQREQSQEIVAREKSQGLVSDEPEVHKYTKSVTCLIKTQFSPLQQKRGSSRGGW